MVLHVESLQKSNHEMNSNLTTTIKNNTDKLKSLLTNKLQMWITSLQIPEEHHNAFLEGYADRMSTGKQ
jgi:hypothetical protein